MRTLLWTMLALALVARAPIARAKSSAELVSLRAALTATLKQLPGNSCSAALSKTKALSPFYEIALLSNREFNSLVKGLDPNSALTLARYLQDPSAGFGAAPSDILSHFTPAAHAQVAEQTTQYGWPYSDDHVLRVARQMIMDRMGELATRLKTQIPSASERLLCSRESAH